MSGRTTITLSPTVASAVRRMGEDMGGDVNAAEVVRRALTVLDVMLGLDDDEHLVVRNGRTHTYERLRFVWQMLEGTR